MGELQVERLGVDKDGPEAGGVVVRVSDGDRTMVLAASWYEKLSERELRSLLAVHSVE